MTRLALAVLLTAATGVTITVTHKRPAQVRSLPASVPQPVGRASRDGVRRPLLLVPRLSETSAKGPSRPASVRRAAPASSSGALSDVTMYCATGSRNAAGLWPRLGDVAVIDRSIPFGTRVRIDGNVYTVEDWIGWGSQFDIFGGNDAGCEARALTYGRRHLSVVVER